MDRAPADTPRERPPSRRPGSRSLRTRTRIRWQLPARCRRRGTRRSVRTRRTKRTARAACSSSRRCRRCTRCFATRRAPTPKTRSSHPPRSRWRLDRRRRRHRRRSARAADRRWRSPRPPRARSQRRDHGEFEIECAPPSLRRSRGATVEPERNGRYFRDRPRGRRTDRSPRTSECPGTRTILSPRRSHAAPHPHRCCASHDVLTRCSPCRMRRPKR